ncbi:hypothetical protein Tco_0128193 [Tanacetum coccineum]
MPFLRVFGHFLDGYFCISDSFSGNDTFRVKDLSGRKIEPIIKQDYFLYISQIVLGTFHQEFLKSFPSSEEAFIRVSQFVIEPDGLFLSQRLVAPLDMAYCRRVIHHIGNWLNAFSCEDLALIRRISFPGYGVLHRFIMDDPNITIEEYIRLEEDKARRQGRTFDWQTAMYGKAEYYENEDDTLTNLETEYPAIVFDDISDVAFSREPTISLLDNNKIEL